MIRGGTVLFVHTTKIYQLQAKDSETKNIPSILVNISGNVSGNIIKKNKIKWVFVQFSCWL